MALVAPGVSNWSLTCVFSSLHSMVQDKPHVAVTTDSCLPSSRRKKIACTRSRGDDLGVSVCHFLPHQVLSSWAHVSMPTLPFLSVAFSPSVAFFSISHCCPWCSLFSKYLARACDARFPRSVPRVLSIFFFVVLGFCSPSFGFPSAVSPFSFPFLGCCF
jgi:hypothetical protein